MDLERNRRREGEADCGGGGMIDYLAGAKWGSHD